MKNSKNLWHDLKNPFEGRVWSYGHAFHFFSFELHLFAGAGAMTTPNAQGGPAGFQRPVPQGIAGKR